MRVTQIKKFRLIYWRAKYMLELAMENLTIKLEHITNANNTFGPNVAGL